MKIQIFNTNGIAGKAEEIQRFAKAQHVDILATFETWLSPTASIPITPVIKTSPTPTMKSSMVASDTLGASWSMP